MPGLQERVDEFKRSVKSGAPPYNTSREKVEVIDRATAGLKGSGAEGRALKVGDAAPSVRRAVSRPSAPGRSRNPSHFQHPGYTRDTGRFPNEPGFTGS